MTTKPKLLLCMVACLVICAAVVAILACGRACRRKNRGVCTQNLRAIDLAQWQCAMVDCHLADDCLSFDELSWYLTNRVMPECPSGGRYVVNPVCVHPICTFHADLLGTNPVTVRTAHLMERLQAGGLRPTRLSLNGSSVSIDLPAGPLPTNANFGVLNELDVEEVHLRASQPMPIQCRTNDLRNCHLELSLSGRRIHDLVWLQDARLASLHLRIDHTPVSDLSPLANVAIESLDIRYTRVTNLSPLTLTPLSRLRFTPWRIRKGLVALRSVPLRQINGVSASRFWEGQTPESLSLTPTRALEEWRMHLESNDVPYVELSPADKVGHIEMQRVAIEGPFRLRLTAGEPVDLSPLKGMPLRFIVLNRRNVTNGMDVLRDMPDLERINATPVAMFWSQFAPKKASR